MSRGSPSGTSATTWVADGQREEWSRQSLGALKTSPLESSADTVERVAADLRDATGQMNNDTGPLRLGLTGGKDSRLLLAASLAAGLEVDCSTIYQGRWSEPDVYVARLVAEKCGVPHRVDDAVARAPGSESSIIVDYLERTASSLRATDGGLYGFDRVAVPDGFRPVGEVTGLGGEILRGGYAERRGPLERDAVIAVGEAQFARTAAFFREGVADRYHAFLRSWVSEFSEDVEGLDMLDCMYAEFRCGRWIAASSRAASTNEWTPFLDNRLTDTMLRIRAVDKHTSRLHRELINRLRPGLANVPLANKFWPGTTKKYQGAMRALHPDAFSTVKPAAGGDDWRRSFPSALVAHILEYCVHDRRIELLSDVLDTDRTAAFLRSSREELMTSFKFVHGVYTACVLVSGDWLKAPGIGRPLELEV